MARRHPVEINANGVRVNIDGDNSDSQEYSESSHYDFSDDEHYHEDDYEGRGPSSTAVRNGSIAPRGSEAERFHSIPHGSLHRRRDRDASPSEPPPPPARPAWLWDTVTAKSYITETRRGASRPGNYWDQMDHENQEKHNRSLVTVRRPPGARRNNQQQHPAARESHQSRGASSMDQARWEPFGSPFHGQPTLGQPRRGPSRTLFRENSPPPPRGLRESRRNQSRRDQHIPKPVYPYKPVPTYPGNPFLTARQIPSQSYENSDTGDLEQDNQQVGSPDESSHVSSRHHSHYHSHSRHRSHSHVGHSRSSSTHSHLEDARERWELERAREQLRMMQLNNERREQERHLDRYNDEKFGRAQANQELERYRRDDEARRQQEMAEERANRNKSDVYHRPADVVHDPSQSTKNITVRLEFDVEEDWDTDLEEFCRFRRLGRFRDAQDHFKLSLERFSTVPYIRIQYAEMLIASGNFKAFRELRKLPEFLPPAEEESTDELNRGKLVANYALLDLLSQRKFPAYVQSAWRIVENTLKALGSEEVIGSTEIQLLSLCLRVLHRLELCTHSEVVDVAKIYAKHLFNWSRLYREISAEDCIWDVRDLLVAATSVFGWQDTSTLFFGTNNIPKVMDLLSKEWARPDYDEPSTLGLLDLYTSLILQDHGKDMEVRNHLLLEYATLLARSIQDHDEELMRSRPFVQWLLAKSLLEMKDVPDRPDGVRLEDFDGLEIKQQNGIQLPIYIPRDGKEKPSWDMFFTRSNPAQRHTVEVAVATAEAIGDYSLKADALKLLILLSPKPGRSMGDLCRLQLDIQGDSEGYLATRLSSYLLLNESNEFGRFQRTPTDSDPARNDTCENASLRWASAMLSAQTLVRHDVDGGNHEPTPQDEQLSSEMIKMAINECGPKLPPYITDFAKRKLELEVPPLMPMLALHSLQKDEPEPYRVENERNESDFNFDGLSKFYPFLFGNPGGSVPGPWAGHHYGNINYQTAYTQPQYPYTMAPNPYAPYNYMAPSPVGGPIGYGVPAGPNPFDFYIPPPPAPPPPPSASTDSNFQADKGNQPQNAPGRVWPNFEVAGWPSTWREDARRLANSQNPPSTEGEDETIKATENWADPIGASPATAEKVSQWLFPRNSGGSKTAKNDLDRQEMPPPAKSAAPGAAAPQESTVASEKADSTPRTKENVPNKEPPSSTPKPGHSTLGDEVPKVDPGEPGPNNGVRRRHTVDFLPERDRSIPNRMVNAANRDIPEQDETSDSPKKAGQSGDGQSSGVKEKPSLIVEEGLPTLSFPPEILQGHKLTVILNSKEDPQKVRAYVIDGKGVHETPVVRPTSSGQHRARTKMQAKSGSYEISDTESQSGGSTLKVDRSRTKDKGKARDANQASQGHQEEGNKDETLRHGVIRPHVVLDYFIRHPPQEKLPKPSRRHSGFQGLTGEGPSRRQSMSKPRSSKDDQDKLPKSFSKRAKKAAQRFSALGPAPSPPPSPPPSGLSQPPPDQPLFASNAVQESGVVSENDMKVSNLDNNGGRGGDQDGERHQAPGREQDQGDQQEQDQRQDQGLDQGQDQVQDTKQHQDQDQDEHLKHDQDQDQSQDGTPDQKLHRSQHQVENRAQVQTQYQAQKPGQKERQYFNQAPNQQLNEELGGGMRVVALDSHTPAVDNAQGSTDSSSSPAAKRRLRRESSPELDSIDEDWEIQSVDGDEEDVGQGPEAVFEPTFSDDEDEEDEEEATRKEMEQMLNDMQTARKRRQEADRAEEEWLKGRPARGAKEWEAERKESKEKDGRENQEGLTEIEKGKADLVKEPEVTPKMYEFRGIEAHMGLSESLLASTSNE